MKKIKNIIYFVLGIILICIEDYSTDATLMAGGIRGGTIIPFCLLLLFFIVYDLFINKLLFRMCIIFSQLVYFFYSIRKNIEMRNINDNLTEYSKLGCDIIPTSDYDFLSFWQINCLFLIYLTICIIIQYISKFGNNRIKVK